MTTKAKPRKAPAAKPAPKAATKELPTGMRLSELGRLIHRHKFLWADQIYQSNVVATTVKESDELGSRHQDEIDEIEDKLAELVPENFNDCRDLLEFASDLEKRECVRDGFLLDVLENVQEGLRLAWENDMNAARADSAAERERKVRAEYRTLIEHIEWVAEGRPDGGNPFARAMNNKQSL